MRRSRSIALVLFTVLVSALVFVESRGVEPRPKTTRTPLRSLVTKPRTGNTADELDSLVWLLVEKAPFRWNRQRAEPQLPPDQDAAPEEPSSPNLFLAGIVWGSTPQAVIEGFPGSPEPRLVVEGDTVSGFRVHSIAPGKVVLSSSRGRLSLELKAAWQ